MRIFPFTQKEVKFFRELNKHKIPFIIVGLASAALQGAPIVTKDVGIWFKDLGSEKLQKVFKSCGATYIPSIELNPPMLAGKGFNLLDIVTHVHGLSSFDIEYKKCIKLKVGNITLKLLPLERIIKSKQVLHREKDIQVIPVLKDVLLTKKKLGKNRKRK